MLNLPPECEALRQRYERGSADPHLEACEECRRFADFVDGLARIGYRAPLEEELRSRLRGVPAASDHGIAPFPRLPDLDLPAQLERELRAIGRRRAAGPQRKTVPIWIRSPRYAVAASYLLTLLIAGTVGNPAAWASQAATRFDRVGVVIEKVEASGRERVGGIGERVTEGYALSKEWIRASRASLRGQWQELVEKFEQRETDDEEDTAGENGASS